MTEVLKRGPKPFTNDQWIERVQELGCGEYTPLSDYKHNQEEVHLRHEVCGTNFWKKPNEWRRLPVCPTCNPPGKKNTRSLGRALTREEAQARIDNVHGAGVIEIIDDFTTMTESATLRHICGHVWQASPRHYTRTNASTCPKCARKWTKERFQQAISESFEGSEYEVVGPYLGSNVPTEVKHASCGNIWFVTPNNFLNGGTRCPACSTPRNSKLSRTVHKALIEALGGLELRREYIFQGDGAPVSVGGRSLSFDFWVPELGLLVEADGLLHEQAWNDAHGRSKLEAQQANDRIKDEWAARNGYTLFRIPHHHPDWKMAVREAVELARERRPISG
jgi:hypothetical protein